MTVSSQTARNDYNGNGVSVDFAVTFRFLEKTQLRVLRTVIATNATTELVLDSLGANGFSVVGAGQPSGGVVTVVTAPAVGERLSILRNVPITQETDYLANDAFPAESHERALDKLTMVLQQQAEITGRSIVLPPQTTGVSTELPGPQALYLLRWKADLTGIENALPPAIATVADGAVVDATVSPIAAIQSTKLAFNLGATGALTTNLDLRQRFFISAEADYGIVADGVTDETVSMTNAFNAARVLKLPVYLPSGTIKTSAELDISGVTLIGVAKGYRNADGTVIEGDGTHDVLVQSTATAADTSIGLHNLRIKGGQWGVKIRYLLHSHWSNVHVTDSVNGIQIGNASDAGPLFNTFDNIETDVTGIGLDVNGNQFANANSFNQCFFTGDQYGARVRCNGGIGAVDNVFNCCEFAGDRYGVDMENTSNTVFNQCYFESLGPSVHFIGTRNIGWAANDCVYAKLENTNATGKNAFFYHAGSGTVRGSIKGGYIYLDNSAVHNNLSFVASENPSTFFLFMADQPERDIAATGFVLLNSLTSANLNINETGTYAPTWTGSISNPALGNGTLTGDYTRTGNQVTVTITLTAGNTTTFGSGNWSFSLPFPCQAQTAGGTYILDAGTGYFDAIALSGAGSSQVSMYRSGGAALVGPTVPMTWTTNDSLTVTLTYRC